MCRASSQFLAHPLASRTRTSAGDNKPTSVTQSRTKRKRPAKDSCACVAHFVNTTRRASRACTHMTHPATIWVTEGRMNYRVWSEFLVMRRPHGFEY